jgi:hypothetical protein
MTRTPSPLRPQQQPGQGQQQQAGQGQQGQQGQQRQSQPGGEAAAAGGGAAVAAAAPRPGLARDPELDAPEVTEALSMFKRLFPDTVCVPAYPYAHALQLTKLNNPTCP